MQADATRSIAADCKTEMAAERAPAHKKHAVAIDNILEALSEAIDSEVKFVDDLVGDGGDATLLPCKIVRPFKMGTRRPSGGWSLIRDWRQRLERHGYLTSKGK